MPDGGRVSTLKDSVSRGRMSRGGKIFIVGEDHRFKEMEPRLYYAEEHLQAFLVDHPDLLPGHQLDSERPRRWLLVWREMGIVDEPEVLDRRGGYSARKVYATRRVSRDGRPRRG